MLGLASTIQQPGILGNAEIFSPRPVASAVPPYTQKAISEPISELISANSSIERPSSQMTFNPLSAAAASELPPARPAETGMCLSIVMRTPILTSKRFFKRRAA